MVILEEAAGNDMHDVNDPVGSTLGAYSVRYVKQEKYVYNLGRFSFVSKFCGADKKLTSMALFGGLQIPVYWLYRCMRSLRL